MNEPVSETRTIVDIYAGHRRALVNYAANLTGDRAAAEDVVQEAWMRLGTATRLRPLDEPLSYLYRIVRNLALDGRRRRRFEHAAFMEGVDDMAKLQASDAPSPEGEAAARSDLRIVFEIMEGLPERMRIAVEMHRLGDAKLKDIAAHLGISVTSAHELVVEGVHRCRVGLRQAKR
ncbi:sigma-70 family RNA polymerase sigma factor [Brevundimonas sp.]|jgi:RNA polymerase sigma factor (sigma-70 family)|uniref:sigma-70 family RNA polymerase sigma factor n=1 Tax=Brevundimonas sp. TaxID=1871086 RepID=UPI0037C091EE